MSNYKYKFNNEYVNIDIDQDWVDMLNEMDRLERNNNIKEQKGHFSLDSKDFYADIIGKEDKNFNALFNEASPAFSYAMEHIVPRSRIIIYRRAIVGDPLAVIAADYDVTPSAIWHYYTKAVKRFQKYYEQGTWLYSSQNIDTPNAPKVNDIPYGLTPSQVLAIRAYREEFASIDLISSKLNIPHNRVSELLRRNPITQTICPYCKKTVVQTPGKTMRIFCGYSCYYSWYRLHGIKGTLPKGETTIYAFVKFGILSHLVLSIAIYTTKANP